MDKVKLPTLKKLTLKNRPQKPKILLLSDDLRMHSGIATMSREFVVGTSDRFDWAQLGAALQHPDQGKIFDISQDVNKLMNIDHASVKIYANTGYGNPDTLRELLELEKPDAILHFTDPRFWGWLYGMAHDIRSIYGIPIMYYNIWDAPPAPFWNRPFYKSCDLIMNISKQTHNLVKMVLGDDNYFDVDSSTGYGDCLVAYVPHGINHDFFYPVTTESKDYAQFNEFNTKFKKEHDVDFIIFWNNRNIRRKQMGDIILAYKMFCDKLPADKAKKVALLMHTKMVDDNGTNLPEVVRVICPDYKVIFNEEKLPTQALNLFYNISDVTINIASNEGFGLSSAESIMAGTPIINNITGGLQDQVRFADEEGNWIDFNPDFTTNHLGRYTEHGSWAKVVFPACRSLQGSPQTPYIFDDRCRFEDVAEAMYEWYTTPKGERKKVGLEGRKWLMSEESGMSAFEMSRRMGDIIEECLDAWTPKERFALVKITDRAKIEKAGVTWHK